MNAKNTKLFRKVFKDRRQYRAYKKAYTRAELKKRLEALEVTHKIVDSGKDIHTL